MTLQPGARVKHLFNLPDKENKYYYGNVVSFHEDTGLYDVRFDDKSLETDMTAADLVLVKVRAKKEESTAPNIKKDPFVTSLQIADSDSEDDFAMVATSKGSTANGTAAKAMTPEAYAEKRKKCPAKPSNWSCEECWVFYHDDAGVEKIQRPHISKSFGNKVFFLYFPYCDHSISACSFNYVYDFCLLFRNIITSTSFTWSSSSLVSTRRSNVPLRIQLATRMKLH